MIHQAFTLIAAVEIGLSGCSRSSTSQSTSPQSRPSEQSYAPESLQPEFVVLPEELGTALAVRQQYVDDIEVPEELQSLATAEQVRTLLRANQALVEKAISASKMISGTLPPAPEFTDAEIEAGAHMRTPQGRLVAAGRELLQADAIRCWEIGDANGCVERLNSSLRIARFMLQQSDPTTRFHGQMVFISAVLELDGRVTDGLVTKITPSIREDTRQLLLSVEFRDSPESAPNTKYAAAWAAVRAAFGS